MRLRFMLLPHMALATTVFALLSCAHSAYKKQGEHEDRVAPQSPVVAQSFGAIWDDGDRCREVVMAKRRLKRAPGKFRVGTWNIRWFPDGRPGIKASRSGTDVAWVACVIAYTNVDVFALQEIKLTERGQEALLELTTELTRFTGAHWKWVADSCPTPSRQHVAILYRTDRAKLTDILSHGELDPTKREGRPAQCPGDLRPALGAYVKSLAGGVDFHFLSAHLDSGRSKRDFENRQKAFRLLGEVQDIRVKAIQDEDLIIAADFNLMGCKGCEIRNSTQERAVLEKTVAALARPLRLATADHDCTEYYKGRGYTIDQVLYSSTMKEAGAGKAKVSGVCAAAKCKDMGAAQLPAFSYLSDHCPVVFDLDDVDDDSEP